MNLCFSIKPKSITGGILPSQWCRIQSQGAREPRSQPHSSPPYGRLGWDLWDLCCRLIRGYGKHGKTGIVPLYPKKWAPTMSRCHFFFWASGNLWESIKHGRNIFLGRDICIIMYIYIYVYNYISKSPFFAKPCQLYIYIFRLHTWILI